MRLPLIDLLRRTAKTRVRRRASSIVNAFALHGSSRSDFDERRPVGRSETARQHDDQGIVAELFLVDQSAYGFFQGLHGAGIDGNIVGVDAVGQRQLAHHTLVVDLGVDGIVPPVGGQGQNCGRPSGNRPRWPWCSAEAPPLRRPWQDRP